VKAETHGLRLARASAAQAAMRQFLAAAVRALAALRDWRLALLLGVCVLLLVLLNQAPLSYGIKVGKDRGPGSDLPFLANFNDPEGDGDASFRWSRGDAEITVPGLGGRGALLAFDVISHQGQQQGGGTGALDLALPDGTSVQLALRPEPAHYYVYVPPPSALDGALRVGLHSTPWQQPGDRRELGVAFGQALRVDSVRDGFALPGAMTLLAWPLALALVWLALRIMGFTPRLALALLLPLAITIPLLQLLDAPRLGFGAPWALQAGALALLCAALSTWLAPHLLRWLGTSAPPHILRWLLLLVMISFVLKYAARLYPASMGGDIQLHVNRYTAALSGELFVVAKHRGLPFPFPPGLYLMLAPFTLLGAPIRLVFQLATGVFEASTVLLLYALVARTTASARVGLLAGATYALTAAGYMTSWFAFETQVGAQWFEVALVLLVVLRWPRLADGPGLLMLLIILAGVFLGHIGLFINVSLLGLLLAPILWWRARDAAERRAAGAIALAGVLVGAFVALFYYTSFMDVVLGQLSGVAEGGLNGATGRAAIPRETSLRVLWEGGLITHYGFFPVLLLVPGALLIGRGRLGRVVAPLFWLTLLISASQGLLPFITLSSITTRWLMFAGWAVAVAGAIGLAMLWRRGRSARVVALAMAAYVCWLTIGVWMNAMALRLPPIEPF
jgi:hypothetical protein